MSKEFAHQPDRRRYALRVDGQLACIVDYAIDDNVITLTRTYTQPPHRGHGYAAELVEFTVSDIEATTSYRIMSGCWYVSEWFEAHPERAALLNR